MEIKVINVYDFNELYNSSWSGAVDTLNTIRENNKEEDFLQMVNDILSSYDGGLDRTALNDYIWFDRDDIYESLGIEEE